MSKVKCKLSELVEVKNGSTPSTAREDFYEGDIVWITPKDLSNNKSKYVYNSERRITKAGFDSCSTSLLPIGSVLLSSRAPIGLLAICAIETCTNQGFKNLVIKKNKINNEYLYYWLKTKVKYIDSLGTGTTFKEVSKGVIENLEIELPENINDQQKIASVLSALDSKIELNNRINAELEAMAKTLYDYWFVQFDFPFDFAQGKPDKNGRCTEPAEVKPFKTSGGKMVWNEGLKREIPEGWEVKRIGDFGEFKNGINYDPSLEGNTDAKIINVRNISSSNLFVSQFDLDTIRLQKSNVDKYLVTDKDILIARSGIPGATRMMLEFAENTIYCGFIIRFQVNSIIEKNYLFYFLKDMEKNTTSKSGGTIMPNVNQDTMKRMLVIEPNEKVVIKFNEFINPVFRKMNEIIN